MPIGPAPVRERPAKAGVNLAGNIAWQRGPKIRSGLHVTER